MSSFSNYDLEWETTSITDFGLDFSVLNSRLTGTIDYYNKVTDGILYNPTLSPTLSYFGSPRQKYFLIAEDILCGGINRLPFVVADGVVA